MVYNAKGVQKSSARSAVRTVAKVCRAGLTPTLISYFLWSGIIYVCCGVFIFASVWEVKAFLCKIPGEKNETANQVLGCENCEGKILMCGKGINDVGKCWKYAMNATLKDIQAKPSFQAAVSDSTCNSLVENALGPVEMLQSIIRERAAKKTKPSDACIEFHCRVLANAYWTNPDLSYVTATSGASTSPTCTNTLFTKPEWAASSCPCNALNVNTVLGQQFGELCRPLRTDFPLWTFTRIMNSKSQCYRTSVQAATGTEAAKFKQMINNGNCTNVASLSSNVFKWFFWKGLQEAQNGPQATVPGYCTAVMCAATTSAMQSCDFAADAELQALTPSDLQPVVDSCGITDPALGSVEKLLDIICMSSASQATLPKICEPTNATTVTTTTAAGTGNGSGATIRRLSDSPSSAVARQPAADSGLGATPHVAGGHFPLIASASAVRLAESRRLQTDVTVPTTVPTANSAFNDALSDYQLSDWSKCTCYQQCIRGVKTRTVTCPPGEMCKQPKPPSSASCTCGHCANCTVFYTMLVFACGYWAQGVFALGLWAAFLLESGYSEDDFVDPGCCSKLLGFFCKLLPPIVRFMTFSTFVFLCAILVSAFAPVIMPDCKESTRLQEVAVLVTVVWTLQVCAGVFMANKNPLPPQLHYKSRKRLIRFFCKPCRMIGP
eukprot:TRINITY_DN30836_c0_g1_i1.p1 TRINITY_DN30836_c0_g1~~TRINITY_DN30836_c0_g1_i1.p1  ORF type:complete len:666 (+),score=141.81 TRINITY_DN30836_c0_g1_i1:253-2250(+)